MSYNVPRHRMQSKRDLQWEPRAGSRKQRKEEARDKKWKRTLPGVLQGATASNASAGAWDSNTGTLNVEDVEKMFEIVWGWKPNLTTAQKIMWSWNPFGEIDESVKRFQIGKALAGFEMDSLETAA